MNRKINIILLKNQDLDGKSRDDFMRVGNRGRYYFINLYENIR